MAYDAKKDVCTNTFPTITLAGDDYEVGIYSYAGGPAKLRVTKSTNGKYFKSLVTLTAAELNALIGTLNEAATAMGDAEHQVASANVRQLRGAR